MCKPSAGVQTWGSFITAVSLAPTIEFEEAAYQVREPPGPEGVAVLNIKVVRRGDQNRTSKVRCSTRDGSAQAGVDYYPKSRVLKFSPGKGSQEGRELFCLWYFLHFLLLFCFSNVFQMYYTRPYHVVFFEV